MKIWSKSLKILVRIVKILLRLVFTSDGVMIGVIIKILEWYDLTSENQTIRVKQNTDSAYDPVACDLVKTRLSESKAEVE